MSDGCWKTFGMMLVLACVAVTQLQAKETVRRSEGDNVTLHTGKTGLKSDDQIICTYGPVSPDIKILEVIWGKLTTDQMQFRDRLQLDRQTGSLNISYVSVRDTGVYKIQIINSHRSEHEYSVIVIPTPVSKPHLRSSSLTNNPCTVECSVENGRDVTLSWYRGEERLNQTSSPDLSRNLSLPLEIKNQDGDTYSCVAENPVSNKTTKLEKTELCEGNRLYLLVPCVLTGLLVLVLVLLYWRYRTSTTEVAGNGDANCHLMTSKDDRCGITVVPEPPESQERPPPPAPETTSTSVLLSAFP